MSQPEIANPYVGPYSFEEKNAGLFFGRDDEAQALLSLVVSERVIVLCSPSGAGKTSLLNARLVPGLREKSFHVLPIARVSGELPPGISPPNVYVFNVICKLAGAGASLAALQTQTLDGYLRQSLGTEDEDVARVLILDQFEEILTTHPNRWEDRRGFFVQLRQALLDDSTLSVVLALREDHLAGLDPFAVLLPGQLRTRFRLERLRCGRAVDAVRRPAEAAGRPFEEGVAERLVENLSQIHLAGQESTVSGEFVEPVQLQVVCFQLWDNLRDRPGKTINEQDRKDFGDIDQALERFYDSAVERAARETGVPVLRIRRFCGKRLITPSRIRSQVAREPETSGDLPNAAIDRLVDLHLIRGEATRGGIWYELAHDRFIDPVLRSNKKAQPPEVTRLIGDARIWDHLGRDSSFLYRGQQLKTAENLAGGGSGIISKLEREFLEASREAQAVERAQVRGNRLLKILATVLSVLLVALLFLFYFAYRQSRLAKSTELGIAAREAIKDDRDRALANAVEAARIVPTPEAKRVLHEFLADPGFNERKERQIAYPARAFAISQDGHRFAALGKSGTVRVWDARSRDPILSLQGTDRSVTSIAFSPDNRWIATGDATGHVILWDWTGRRQQIVADEISPINALAFSPDGSLLAVADDDSESPADAVLWNTGTGSRKITLSGGHSESVLDLAFSPDGKRLATASADDTVRIWSLASGQPLGPPLDHPYDVTGVAFSPQGVLATSCLDGYGRIWVQPVRILPHLKEVWDVDFSPDGRFVATADIGGTLKIWDPETTRQIRGLTPPECQAQKVQFVRSPASGSTLLALACDSDETGDRSTGRIYLWKQTEAFPVLTSSGKGEKGTPIGEMAFSKDGRFLAARDLGGKDWLWQLGGGIRPWTPNLGTCQLSFQDRILICQASPGKTVQLRNRGRAALDALALSIKGDRLATWQGDAIRIFDTSRPGTPPLSFNHREAVQDLAFRPDGLLLAVAARGVQLMDTGTGQRRGTLLPDLDVIRIAFSPDGGALAAGTPDGVRICDGEGREIFRLRGSGLTALAYSPDGRWLAVATSDGTIRLEPMEIKDLIKLAEKQTPKRMLKVDRWGWRDFLRSLFRAAESVMRPG